MSGNCRTPKNEPISQHNKAMCEQDDELHKALQLALIPKEALEYIKQLQAEVERKDKALENIVTESGKVDIENWPAQQQICQTIANKALKDK